MVKHEIIISLENKDSNILREVEALLNKNLFEKTAEDNTWIYTSDIGQFVASVQFTFTEKAMSFEICAIDSSVLTDVIMLINKLKD